MRMFALDILPLHTLNSEDDDNENNKEDKRPPDRLRERGRGCCVPPGGAHDGNADASLNK